MDGPRISNSHPDHLLECEEALEREVTNVIERAEAAGWERAIIVKAITSLGENYLRKVQANEAVDRQIGRELLRGT